MNKYHNQHITIDNIKFASKKEAKRYQELKLLEKAGAIKDLQIQVKFELQPSYKINNKTIRSITYIADFTYYENDKLIVEDTKGFRNEVYLLKKKLFAYKYGIEITEN